MNQITKYLITLAFVTVGFALLSDSLYDSYNYRAQMLAELWRKDIERLHSAHILPKELSNLREIEWIAPDPLAQYWSKNTELPFTPRPDGRFKLELLILSQTDDGQMIAVIQHHLIDLNSGNSIWELGRTYDLARP